MFYRMLKIRKILKQCTKGKINAFSPNRHPLRYFNKFDQYLYECYNQRHSAPVRNLMKFQIPKNSPSQGEWL